MRRAIATFLAAIAVPALSLRAGEKPMLIERRARETLTAVEMDCGDTLRFTLRNGETRTLVLEATGAKVLVTNLKELKKARDGGGTLYHFTARVRVDGQPMTMERYVGSQESFYEPYVVNGLRIWFDGVADIFEFLTEKHGECKPAKQARFALQDATLAICPQEIQPWYPNDKGFIAIRDCYCGDDPWLGAYQGADAHGGLDVNMPKGTPHWAPIDFDDHWYFNSLALGHNNNRWRAVRRWPDGSLWTLQSHHLIRLLVPEHTPLKAGTHYAEAAGVHVGAHPHSHFVFKITEGEATALLDPWIIFWEVFETQKRKAGALRAAMAPLRPARTGQPVAFRRIGAGGQAWWTFGDGAAARGDNPAHTFLQPGIYPVTLTVDDGKKRAAFTQHITVDGEVAKVPGLALAAPDEPGFRPRPVQAMDVYGWPPGPAPHTIEFLARATRPAPRPKAIELRNSGAGTLAQAKVSMDFESGAGWLAAAIEGTGNAQRLMLKADASGLKPGDYAALVSLDCPGAANAPQPVRVLLRVKAEPPQAEATLTTRSPGFYCTPYFWACPGHHTWPKGHGGQVLTNGARAAEDELARFTPALAAGRYEVALSPKTPFDNDAAFLVRVRHASGDDTIRVQPAASRTIGTFVFDEGADGFVEILARDSAGQVLVDAVSFKRVP